MGKWSAMWKTWRAWRRIKPLLWSALVLALVVLGVLWLCGMMGCASTPASRIAANQAYFDGLPVAAQARIRGGQIEAGFTPGMVQLALGDPSRRMVRHEAGAVEPTEVWLYTTTDRHYERQQVEIVDIEGSPLHRPARAWVTVLQERELVGLRVEFVGGRVRAWETYEEGARP